MRSANPMCMILVDACMYMVEPSAGCLYGHPGNLPMITSRGSYSGMLSPCRSGLLCSSFLVVQLIQVFFVGRILGDTVEDRSPSPPLWVLSSGTVLVACCASTGTRLDLNETWHLLLACWLNCNVAFLSRDWPGRPVESAHF